MSTVSSAEMSQAEASTSRPISPVAQPPNAAEVRSQAVAMLKRAASLPRRTDTRRPSNSTTPTPQVQVSPQPELHLHTSQGVPSGSLTPRRDAEELLSSTPSSAGWEDHPFDHHHPHAGPSAYTPTHLRRSASASSSYHMPTPSSLAGYSQVSTPLLPPSGMVSPITDWSAVQLAQSYLPSLSPVAAIAAAAGQSPYMAPIPSVLGRNTPSPLPSLGELRTLQRSNSAAARAKAMDKLTGGSSAATSDEGTDGTPTKAGLQRADSLGAPRMLGQPMTKTSATRDPHHPPSAFVDPRPRLQRSFTVSSGNMGEERRSAVGRRMVARLGERRAAQETEEEDVRKLWEERRGLRGDQAQGRNVDDEQAVDDADEAEDLVEGAKYEEDDRNGRGECIGDEEDENDEEEDEEEGSGYRHGEHEAKPIPGLVRYSPIDPPYGGSRPSTRGGNLDVPQDDRPYSRTTQISEGDAFEYEAHLRRSLSSRTARGAVGTIAETPRYGSSRQAHHVEQLDTLEANEGETGPGACDEIGPGASDEEEEEKEPIYSSGPPQLGLAISGLERPRAPFATPSRNGMRGSTSTESTQSPGGESTMSGDGLQSMMFVMGCGSGVSNGIKRETNGFPVDVDEGGTSNWGTPAKVTTLYMSQSTSSIGSPTAAPPLQTPRTAYEDTLSPPDMSARSSVMSWEELGGDADREIPTEENYRKKSGSISSKVGRAVKGAMRKRSQSRSSTGSATSPPTSPKSIGEALTIAVQSFSRRGSQSSVSPSQASTARSFARGSPMTQQGEFMRHQPSVSSLAPSILDESSANGLLLQHQLSNDPQPVREMPRAKIDDPRVFNSKLSPFPGVESRRPSDSLPVPEIPRLLHQSSDSAVPSQQRVTPQVPDSIHSLPLPISADHVRRGSDESIGRRNWLAKAFGSSSTPRSSAGMSRQSSLTGSHTSGSRASPEKQLAFAENGDDIDPFAGPPPPPPPPILTSRSRAISPSVSTVAEANEEGSRLTQFTVHRSANPTPVHGDITEEPPERSKSAMNVHAPLQEPVKLPPKSQEVLARMDEVLALAADDPARPDILDDPPRKLLLATQVLQVVNMHTVKDRFLLLFNDILVICKPIIENGTSANLNMRFNVKSIVSLDKLHVSGFTKDLTHSHSLASLTEERAILDEFSRRFELDAAAACAFLIGHKRWKGDTTALAGVLFKSTRMDKEHLGVLLASDEDLLNAYLDAFNSVGVGIDAALRLFLLAVSLPGDSSESERLLFALARRYFLANRKRLPYDLERTHSLITGMMMLSDSIHGPTFGFALHNPGLTPGVWISAYRERDSQHLVPSEMLRAVYASMQRLALQPPLSTDQAEKARTINMTPDTLSSRLICDEWSEPITISIPGPDAQFRIKLVGEGFEAEPKVLDFTNSSEVTFRLKGLSVGPKTILFARLGLNASLYPDLGNGRNFQVERDFMKYTFQVAFANHLGLKRRYCFSVPDIELRTKWGVLLPRQMSITRQKRSIQPSNAQQKIRRAAEGVALLVLRDALIPPPEKGQGGPGRMERSGSVSVAYGPAKGMGTNGTAGEYNNTINNDHQHNDNDHNEKSHNGLMTETTGKEVVLVCRQNSLLPGMLELLQAGVEPKDRGARF